MSGAQEHQGEHQGAQRIDKWLWHARFARTRSAAQRLALSGHIRVNRDKVEAASRLVRPGDVLTLALGRGVQVIRIRAIAERRGGAVDAQRLYADLRSEEAGGAAADAPGDPPEDI